MAACLLKRRYGPLGNIVVDWYDLLNENSSGNPTPDSLSDMAAEQHGLSCASGRRSCEQECLDIYRTPERGGHP